MLPFSGEKSNGRGRRGVSMNLFGWLADCVGAALNRVIRSGPYPVPEAVKAFHQRLLVADMHCDALLWGRDLNRRGRWGHVDVPRLIEGNAALQIFSAPSRVPMLAFRLANVKDRWDIIRPLFFTQGLRAEVLKSARARVLHMAAQLDRTVQQSENRLIPVRSHGELARFLAHRAENPGCCGAVLSIEGLHSLEDSLDNIQVFYDAGFRMMGLTHFHDNAVGGSAHGTSTGGLTPFGREALRLMENKRIIIDLAHAAPRLIDDVLACATRPVVVSHTGFQAVRPGPRNLSDAHARRIAEQGGLIGVGFWPAAAGGRDIAAIIRAIRHAVEVIGLRHVALGSDFDGSVPMPMDVSGMPLITQALLENGFTEAEIEAIMGGNLFRFLHEMLPEDGAQE